MNILESRSQAYFNDLD